MGNRPTYYELLNERNQNIEKLNYEKIRLGTSPVTFEKEFTSVDINQKAPKNYNVQNLEANQNQDRITKIKLGKQGLYSNEPNLHLEHR